MRWEIIFGRWIFGMAAGREKRLGHRQGCVSAGGAMAEKWRRRGSLTSDGELGWRENNVPRVD